VIRPGFRTIATGLAVSLAVLNLLGGIGGALVRLGWGLPIGAPASHGAVMIGGFFGTLIGLERAVAVGHRPAYAVPLAAGLGGWAALFADTNAPAAGAWLLAAGGLVWLYLWAGLRRAWSVHLLVQAAGAVCWGLGVLAWWIGDLEAAVAGWIAFLTLTIAGERRELTRLTRLPGIARHAFVVIVAGLLVAVLGTVLLPVGTGARVWARGLDAVATAALALWLLRWDIARHQWSAEGWIGHTAQCLVIGYVWLLAGALLAVVPLIDAPASVQALAGLSRHAVLLGFVFAMVFGHAPVILPALAGLRPVYSPWARAAIVWLSASLVLRGASLVAARPEWLAWAGIGHAIAIVGFAAVMARGAFRYWRQRERRPRRAAL